MLWVDKYRPHTLDKVMVHVQEAQHLQNLIAEGDCPHLLFYGPSGAGKKTLIMALLREMYGPGAEKVKVENKAWKVEAGTRKLEIDLTTVSSNYHVEFSPSDAGFQDRYVVQEIIKDMAKSRPLDVAGNKGFKVLVLNEVDKLSREAQHSLRRTMEKYSTACRLILCCNSASKVIEAIRSRCLNIRIRAPAKEELWELDTQRRMPAPKTLEPEDELSFISFLPLVTTVYDRYGQQAVSQDASIAQRFDGLVFLDFITQVLQYVAKQEGVLLPIPLAARIAVHSNRNLRQALLSFEACYVHQYPFSENQPVQGTDWEQYVMEIANDIVTEQSPKRLFQVRGKLYELLTNCIPPEVILKRLLMELMRKLDSELKREVCHWAAFYEHRMQLGQKAIFHLEAFVAKFMSIYKRFLIATFG